MANPFLSNPFDADNPFTRHRPAPPPWRQPLPAAQGEGFISQLAGRGASGLGYVAGSLDKPGRAVRGLLAGRPDELAAAVPFSDALGLTDPGRAVSGKDLLDKMGVTSPSNKGWAGWGAGIAAEMATDPLTYLTFGARHALTPVGQALKKQGMLRGMSREGMLQGFEATESGLRTAGRTAPEVSHFANQGRRLATSEMEQAAAKAGHTLTPGQPLSGLFGVGLPFRPPVATFGKGQVAQGVARGMDAAGSALRYGNPVGLKLGQWFDPEVLDAQGALAQRAAKSAAPLYDKLHARGQGEFFDTAAELAQKGGALTKAGVPSQEVVNALNLAREGNSGLAGAMGIRPGVMAEVGPLGGSMRGVAQTRLAESKNLGAPLKNLDDEFVDYAQRRALSVPEGGLSLRPRSKAFTPASGANSRRIEMLREIPGGTPAVDRWKQAHAGHTDVPGTAAQILKDMTDFASAGGTPVTDPAKLAALAEKSEALSKWLKKMDPAQRDVPYFTPNVPAMEEVRGAQHAKTMRATDALVEGLTQSAQRGLPVKGQSISLAKAIKNLGLTTTMPDAAKGVTGEGALVESLKRLARKGQGPVDGLLGDAKALRRAGKGWSIPVTAYEDLSRNYQKWVAPTSAAGPLKAWDAGANWFKNMAYSVWPASHARNATSAAVANAVGIGAPDLKGALGGMTGTADPAAVAKLFPNAPPAALASPEAASEFLRGQAFRHAGVFGGVNGARELSGTGDSVVKAIAAGADPWSLPPGATPAGGVDPLKAALGTAKEALVGKTHPTDPSLSASPFKFWQQSGLLDRKPWQTGGDLQRRDLWSPLAAGRKVGTAVEDFSRLSGFLAALKKGYSPEEAGRLVNKVHFDYGKVTNFERNVMKRLVPFYTFSRHNLPLQMEYALHTPSRLTAQLRPLTQMSSPGQYVPDYLSSGVAVPVGEGKEGTQRYVSSLGLPVEEAFQRLKFDGGLPDWKGTAMGYLSGLNPLIKGPLEALVDRQFFSGRKLSDLRPTAVGSLGGALGDENAGLLTQALANTPATRFISTLDKMLDERKGLAPKALNLLSGVRVQDVDVNKSRAVEARNALEGMMRGSGNLSSYTNFYVRPEDQANLTDRDVRMMQAYKLMQDNARAYAESKRAGSL